MSSIVLTDAAGNIKPPTRNAQMGTKIYFWHNPRTDHILQGAGPPYDRMMPPGYELITCDHPWQAERWSARLREQDKRMAEMETQEREFFEGKMRADLRRETLQLKNNVPLGLTPAQTRLRDMVLQKALDQLDEAEKRAVTKRESYLHVEAFEHGR